MTNRTTQPMSRPVTAGHPAPQPWNTFTVPLAPGNTAALTHLRALAHHALLYWGIDEDRAGEILVVLSELVTNALIHTHGPARVRFTHRAGQIRLDVSDTSTEKPDQNTGPTDGEHGYGLALIASALADEITCRQRRDGKVISARFDNATR